MKRILLVLALAWIAVTASSCSDWLDLKPYDGVVEENYWNTKEDVNLAVIGCYSSMLNKNLITNMFYWGELRADMVAGGASAGSREMNVIRGEISPENTILKWNEFYTTISYCNKVIEKSELVRTRDVTFSDELYRQYVGEAVTIRSLMYFYLLRSFKDVPLVLKASDSDQQDYYPYNYNPETGVGNEQMMIDTLTTQLSRVMMHLPMAYNSTAESKGRVTRWTAMALLADIYLWQGNYIQCEKLCTQIINSKQFSLIPVYRSPEYVYDETTGDIVDTVYIANSTYVERWFNYLYVSGNSYESLFELQFPTVSVSLDDPFFDLFNYATTPRTVLVPNSLFLVDGLFPESETRNPAVKDIRSTNFQQGLVWKWVGLESAGTSKRVKQRFPHWMVYRYADIILMKAEALNQLALIGGDNQMMWEAYQLTRQIMVRSNAVENVDLKFIYPIDGKNLEQLILNERAREFAFEGKRWYDLLRFAKRNNFEGREYLMQAATNSAPPEKLESLKIKYGKNEFLYWPIFIDEVEMNKNLRQNEYYQ